MKNLFYLILSVVLAVFIGTAIFKAVIIISFAAIIFIFLKRMEPVALDNIDKVKSQKYTLIQKFLNAVSKKIAELSERLNNKGGKNDE